MKKILIFLFCILPLSVQAKSDCETNEQNCWDCGKTENDLCTARLNTTTKALSITGSGEMRDYNAWVNGNPPTDAPWGFNYTSVNVDGVKSIGAGAFRGNGNRNFTSATISDSVISIGVGAFSENFALTDIRLGSSIEHIGGYAFGGDYKLASIFIPDSILTTGTEGPGILIWSGAQVNGSVSYYCPADKKSLCTGGGNHIKTYTKDQNGVYQTGGQYYASPDAMVAQNSCGANEDGSPSQKCIDDALEYKISKAKSMAASGSLCQTTTGCLKLMDMAENSDNCTTIASCYTYGSDNGILFNDPNMLKNADGSYNIYDEEGKIIGFKGKRIYTVDEATLLAKPQGNTFKLRYR